MLVGNPRFAQGCPLGGCRLLLRSTVGRVISILCTVPAACSMTGDRRFHLPRVRSEKFKRDEKMPEFIKADMLAELERQGQLKNSPSIPLQQHETTQLHINHWGSCVLCTLTIEGVTVSFKRCSISPKLTLST
jgi:hypothetical protein